MNRMQLIKRLFASRNGNTDDNAASRSWYRIENKNDSTVADVYIYDEISWLGVDPENFVKDIAEIRSETIRVHLNTPGGYVFDGVAIYNALKNHKAKIETHIDGLAASIGSVIAMAGETIYMAENAFLMIHDPFVIAIGNADDLRKTAGLLDKIKGTLVATYAKRTGNDSETIEQWMKEETWFTAKEAKENGFVDHITDEAEEIENQYDLSVFNHAPEVLLCQLKKAAEDKELPDYTSMQMRLKLAAHAEADACQCG